MPVWAVWHDGALYFSTARTSTKARNLHANPRCTVTGESADEAVILEGEASVVDDPGVLAPVWKAYKDKYDWDLEGESLFSIKPTVVFAFIETTDDFPTAATRWTFA
jgi:hypothetical protein